MKIRKLVSFPDAEVEVNISSADIAAAIADDDVGVLCGINNCGAFLKAVPNSAIREMNASQRATIVSFLAGQAERFRNV